MHDWDILMKNMARGGSFVGRGTPDEDAYFSVFAGDENDRAASHTVWESVISNLQKLCMRPVRP